MGRREEGEEGGEEKEGEWKEGRRGGGGRGGGGRMEGGMEKERGEERGSMSDHHYLSSRCNGWTCKYPDEKIPGEVRLVSLPPVWSE